MDLKDLVNWEYCEKMLAISLKQSFGIDSESDYVRKDKILLRWLDDNFKQMFDGIEVSMDIPHEAVMGDKVCHIWMYWDTPSKTPLVVRKCIERVTRLNEGCSVHVVSEDNVSKYIDIDAVIWEKYRKGIISKTHFSDIVRVALLLQYGGVWMDSTLYLTKALPASIFEKSFFTATPQLQNKPFQVVSRGKWTVFFIACQPGNELMRLTYLMMNEYWKKFDMLFDYLWMDYFWAYLSYRFPCIDEMLKSVEPNNLYCLHLKLAKEYDEEQGKYMLNDDKNTWFYKLSYKFSASIPLYNFKGKETIFGHIITH